MFREEVEEFFASMDRDFDGRLSFEEFMGEVPPQYKSLIFVYLLYLLLLLLLLFHRNTYVDIYEYKYHLERYKCQESIIEKLFKNMDKNGDGVVTKEVIRRSIYNAEDSEILVNINKADNNDEILVKITWKAVYEKILSPATLKLKVNYSLKRATAKIIPN